MVQAPIDPAAGGTGEVMYAAATGQRGALAVSAVLLILSGMLMVAAVMGIAHQARDRGAGLANAGAVLGVLGGFGHFAIALFYAVALALPGGDRAEMVASVERLNASAVLGVIVFPLILCFGLGVLVLAWAAWRAGLVGLWGSVLVTVGVLAHNVLPFQPPTALTVALLAAMTAVFGHLGLRVLAMRDDEWQPAPAARIAVPAPA